MFYAAEFLGPSKTGHLDRLTAVCISGKMTYIECLIMLTFLQVAVLGSQPHVQVEFAVLSHLPAWQLVLAGTACKIDGWRQLEEADSKGFAHIDAEQPEVEMNLAPDSDLPGSGVIIKIDRDSRQVPAKKHDLS